MSDSTPADEGTDAPDAEAASEDETQTLYGVEVVEHLGQRVLHPSRDSYAAVVDAVADDGYHMVTDLTAVDYLHHPDRRLPASVSAERFEIVVTMRNLFERSTIRLRVQVPEADPSVPSLYDRFPGVEAMEREVYDMFGIGFDGHPDLTRILMPEGWDGHPLRKDYEVGNIPVQFKAAHS